MLKTQIVDVSRSAIITDPEAFYENLMSTGQEDAPEKTMPIVAYEGYNFLPTVYGYRSYFDVTPKVDIQALPSKCDKLINFQLSDYSNLLIALTEDGIYVSPGKVSGAAWTLEVAKTAPGVGQYKEWTYCVIENKLYMYRQGDSTAHVRSNLPGYPTTAHTPSFLNMSGQMGIFRANGRLGFWDSANSISWSSVFDLTDFTPSIETLAGNVIFNDVLGRIVSIKASGSGFVIYTTKNIVGAAYSTGGSILFDAHTIAETAGIWSSKQVCTGVMDTEHYAYTNTGIKHISNAEKVENVFAPIYDFLKEARDPVYLDFLQGRYIFINVINPAYIDGYVTFAQVDVSTYTVRLLYDGGECTVTPPTEIQGVPLADALVNSIATGLQNGMYAQWSASGSKLIPSRSPSSMNPYQIDDPFTPADDYPYLGNADPFYTADEIIDIRDTGVWVNKISIDNSVPMALALGWHNAPLGTGRKDSELQRMFNRQIAEWNEYTSLIQVLSSGLAGAAGHSVEDTTILRAGYAGPSTVAVDSGWTTIGSVLDPGLSHVTQTETFSGVDTYSPSCSLDLIYNNILPVQRRVVTTTSWIGNVYGVSVTKTITGGDGIYNGTPSIALSSNPFRAGYDPGFPNIFVTDTNTTVAAKFETMKSYMASIWVAPTSISFTDPHNPDVTYPVTGFDIYESSSIPLGPGPDGIVHGMPLSFDYIITYRTNHTADPFWYTETHAISLNDTIEYKRITTDITLRLGTSTSSTPVHSTLTANQNILDWAIYTVESPPTGFDWDTNEQVVGSDIPFLLSPSLPALAGVTYPGATFLLQDATPAAIFPDFVGSLVYDTYLQKWGKMKASFRALLDYAPINSNNNGSIPYSNFGLDAGILASTGFVKLFSAKCADTKIRYGKFAMSRQGFTNLEVVEIKFRKPFTGTIQVDVSLDGRSIHSSLTQSSSFVGVGIVEVNPDYSGKWFIITIIGEFDLRSMEFIGRPAGIR